MSWRRDGPKRASTWTASRSRNPILGQAARAPRRPSVLPGSALALAAAIRASAQLTATPRAELILALID